MILKKTYLACVVLGGAALVAACGGGGGPGLPTLKAVSTSDLKLTANATTGPAVIGTIGSTAVSFPNGFTGLKGTVPVGVTGPTTVVFTGPTASPAVSITSPDGVATGDTTFGSCIFKIKTSTFAAGKGFQVGDEITIPSCTVTVKTAGGTSGAGEISTTASVTFGTATSASYAEQFQISSDGVITIGGTALGTVTIQVTTGGQS